MVTKEQLKIFKIYEKCLKENKTVDEFFKLIKVKPSLRSDFLFGCILNQYHNYKANMLKTKKRGRSDLNGKS